MGGELTQQKDQSPKTQLLTVVESKLGEVLKKNIDAFPKGFNETRFLQNCMTVLQETKDIEKCSPPSVVRTLVKGAYLGLDFFQRECYAIPFGDQLTLMVDYKGSIKLCLKYGRNVKDIYAKLVREGDVLEVGIENGIQSVKFTEKLFNNGDIQGAFAVVVFENGTTRYETMSLEEIEYIRKTFSRAKDSAAWVKSFGEMCKKTVLRRLTKMIDLHFDNHEQEKAYIEDTDADLTGGVHHEPKKADNPFDPKASMAKPDAPQDAVLVQTEETPATDPDAALRAELRKQHPDVDEWDLDDLVEKAKRGITIGVSQRGQK